MITPKQLSYALEHIRFGHFPGLGKTEFYQLISRRFGRGLSTLHAWTSGKAKIPGWVDTLVRIRHNYPELSWDFVQTLPLPPHLSIPRHSEMRLGLLNGIEEAFGIMTYSRDWKDRSMERVEWSPGIYKLFGLDADIALDHDLWLEAIHPQDRARMRTAFARYANGEAGRKFHGEYRIINLKDMSEHRITVQSWILFREGRPIASVGFAVEDKNIIKIP